MSRKCHRSGFSITELILVVSSLGLLATFTVPLPHGLRQQQRITSCLGNLGRLGAASLTYAQQDQRSQLVPLHAADVTPLHGIGWLSTWGWRTALPSAFGGQTPVKAFPVDDCNVAVMLDEFWPQTPNPWGAQTRPLNSLVQAGGRSLEDFHCPADTGYPAEMAAESPDVPVSAVGIPCFEMLGNSYRTNRCGMVFLSGNVHSAVSASLVVGPPGHSPEQIPQPSRTVLYSDPLFYSVTRHLSPPDVMDPVAGWHGVPMADNVAYCDGSARLTHVGALEQFSPQQLQEMRVSTRPDPRTFLRRGPDWQMDCYPSPGALIRTYSIHGPAVRPNPISGAETGGWPFENFSTNEDPFATARPSQSEPVRWSAPTSRPPTSIPWFTTTRPSEPKPVSAPERENVQPLEP